MAKRKAKQLTLNSQFSELEKIKPFINEFLRHTGDKLRGKIRLAVNEAATNALIHGNKQDQTKKIIIKARRDETTIEVTVEDEGEGFDPASLPSPTDQKQLLNEGGRGVFLIKQYASEVSFEDNGSLVRMKFYL